jgi:hypothetical protein
MADAFKSSDQALTASEVFSGETDQQGDAVPAKALIVPGPANKLPRRRVITTATLSSRTCRWPVGDPARPDFHYCGDLPTSGRVYCSTHESMSYNAAPRRRSS